MSQQENSSPEKVVRNLPPHLAGPLRILGVRLRNVPHEEYDVEDLDPEGCQITVGKFVIVVTATQCSTPCVAVWEMLNTGVQASLPAGPNPSLAPLPPITLTDSIDDPNVVPPPKTGSIPLPHTVGGRPQRPPTPKGITWG